MADSMGGNISIILFLALLGAFGGHRHQGRRLRRLRRSGLRKDEVRSGALLATSALGALIFIDDYFNCLTVGTVMRPVTDKHKVSRVKLAYIIDATAAPICIIAPISSWAAAVGSQMEEAGLCQQYERLCPDHSLQSLRHSDHYHGGLPLCAAKGLLQHAPL